MADGKIDVLIHCGDGVRDLETVEEDLLRSNPNIRIYAVRGNCDLAAQHYPAMETTMLNNIRTLITHGHNYQVKHSLGKLSIAARSMGISLVFFGHTHQPTIKVKHGVTLINPGSLASWAMDETAYLQVILDEKDQIHENYVKFHS